jgi:hypothetical protein
MLIRSKAPLCLELAGGGTNIDAYFLGKKPFFHRGLAYFFFGYRVATF